MIKTNLPLVCQLCFFVIFAVLGVLCHHCSSLHKTDGRTVPPQVARNLTLGPSLIRGSVQPRYHTAPQQEDVV